MGILYFIMWILYFPFMESRGGTTFGKKIVGIKVLNANGEPVGFLRSLGRNLAKIISALILMIGFMMAGFTKKKQGLHDIIASCVVVKSKETSAGKIWAVIILIIVVCIGTVVIAGAQFLFMLSSLFSGGIKIQTSSNSPSVTQFQNNGNSDNSTNQKPAMPATSATPAINSINPTSGPADTTRITMSGNGFTASNNAVYLSAVLPSYFDSFPSSTDFGLLIAKIGSSDTHTLQFIIPSSIPDGGGTSFINAGTYTLTVVNANGNSNHTTFTVTPSKATSCVINSFTASPLTVPTGGTSSLSWNTNNCTNIQISNTGLSTFNKQVGSSGSMSVSPTAYPQSSTTYTIEAHDATDTGVATNSVTVMVNP